jgi:hypothetical protein
MSRDRTTTRLAGRQQGLLTTKAALQVGWSASALDRATRSGRIERPEPGVLRIGGAPLTWRQQLLARCLTEDGVASHRAAAALWGLEGFEPRILDVTVRRWARRPNESVGHLHESTRLTDEDVTEIDGIPCTTVEWTLVHLGAVAPRLKVEIALDDALRRGLTTPERVWAVRTRVAQRGVRGVGVIRPLLVARLGTSGRRPNGFERKLFRILDAAGVPLPTAQLEIRDGEFVAYADWGYADRRVVIECVSDEWHSGRVRRHRDTTRRNRIVNLGYDVLEFTSDHVRYEKEYVAATTLTAYERGARHLA